MRNIITSLIAGLLIFSVAFSAVKGPIKAPKMVKQQREVEPLPTMQANDRTYWNSPATHELRNGAFATVVDSSGNGYGMVSSVTSPLDVNDDGNMFISYRQYAGAGTTHGQLGGAFSEDGEEWDAYYNLNANGNPPWGGGSGVGNGNETTAQARYPSALASGDYPYAIWNEYTGLGVGYGGQLYWTYDQTGWDVGSFMYPEMVDLLWNDFKDLWLASPSLMYNEEEEQYNAVVSCSDWTRSNNYYFRTETITEEGYMVFGEEQIVIDEQTCLTPGDASGSFNTAPKISTGDNGFGVMGIIGFFPGAGDGASDISNYHLPIFKITEDYGQSWHGPSGDPADACDFYYVPNDVLDDMVANFPLQTYVDECGGYEYYIVDYWSYYDFDYKIDADGNPHILMSVIPSDEEYVFWIEGAGWYHFTIDVEYLNNPGPVNSETGWNYSMVMPMEETWQFNANDGDTNVWQTQASLSFSKDDSDVVWVVADAMNEYVCGTLADDGGTPEDPCDDLFDYTGLSEDIFVVKSTDGGHSWFNPLNATNTVDDEADYPPAWHGDCPAGLLWCGPEENYPHAAHWSTEDEVYYMFQMPNWGFNEIGDLLGPDHMNRVYVGVAEVTDDEEDSYPPDCGDDAPDVDPGDTNFDGTVDVLDIVAIVNHILGSSELEGDSALAADYNVDGTVDVLDIVAIVNLILGNREAEATSVKFIQLGNSVTMESNGYVGAVQMTIEHGPDFDIDITNNTVLENVSAFHTEGNKTTLIVVTPTDGELFAGTDSRFVISEAKAAGDDDYIRSEIADSYVLVSSYPNPFNPSTTINYTMGVGGSVDISIYNVMGQKVANLVNGVVDAGSHSVIWNGVDMNGVELSSGVYLMQVQTSNDIVSSKLTLMR